MKESKTIYSYLIEHMQTPSFQKVWDVACDFVYKLPSDLSSKLHESLNRGLEILDSEPLLQMYIYSFGKMHNAKLQYSFEHLCKNAIKYNEIEIVDYGCGQGLATICYHDFLLEHNIGQNVKRIILIEPSLMALSRAELLCSKFYPDAEVIGINKNFDELVNEDLALSVEVPTFHFLSNILDVESYDIFHFSRIVKESSVGDNEYVLVSPMQNSQRIQRLKTFACAIEKNVYFEQYLDKGELNTEKDWTCALILCSQRDVIKYDCEEVFEESKSYVKNKGVTQTKEYSKELFSKLEVCANFGDKMCQNMLGLFYKKGIGIEQDYKLALEYFMKSAEQEYASAFGNIGDLYYRGDGVEQDFQKAIDYYSTGSNYNHPGCKFCLGRCYFYGNGVEKDLEKAFLLFSESSQLDYLPAKYGLFLCYINGYGTEKNEKAGIKLLRQMVKLNYPIACYKMAKFCESGKYMRKDERKAFGLIKKAAKLGNILAQEKLGCIYKNGLLGEEESPKKAFNWYYKAAEQGNVSAQFSIGCFYANGYGVKKNDNLAFEWYYRAAQQNSSAALNNLAVCYEYGNGVEIDLVKAVYYYKKAANLGDIVAQKNIANCYFNGIGVEVDSTKVFFWTLEAAKKSDLDSQRKVAIYYLKGYGINRDREKALIWYAKYYFKSDVKNEIDNIEDAYRFFMEKANEGDPQALYIIGKCLQYGIATGKKLIEADIYFQKAADLGHIESLIKVKRLSSLYDLSSMNKHENSFKDSYGFEYSADKKILISSGYQNMKEYKIPKGTRIICDSAFRYGKVKKIIIPSSVIMVGKNPFPKEIRFGNSIENIECHSNNFVVFDSALYTSNKKKLISYFGEASKFTIPNGVEIIGENAFYENDSIKEVEFPNTLLSIEDKAFSYCLNLKTLTLPKNIVSIGQQCFYGCESLSEVLSLGSISVIKEGTFKGCNISKLILPNSLIVIENNAFTSNSKLDNVIIPNSVRKIGDSCFAYCGITNISLNDNIEEIGNFCFFNCPIYKIVIPSKVKIIGINPFIGVDSIECANNGKFVSENGLLYDKEKGELIASYSETEIALYPPISSIKSFAFYNSEVTDIFMSNNIIEIDVWAFYNAKKLERVIWRKSKVQRIPIGCFAECVNISKIDIPLSVMEVQKGSFGCCYNLKSIYFYSQNIKVNEEIFERVEDEIKLPQHYRSPLILRGSLFTEGYERSNINFNSFDKIEINIPYGCSDNFKFETIYDRYTNCSYMKYGMDRSFILKENE